MSSEITLSAYALSSVAALLIGSFFVPLPRLRWPRIKLRAHTEKLRGFRVVDLGLALTLPKTTGQVVEAKPRAVEFAVYFTMRV